MTTWVLLRGLTREAGHWGDFAQRLADRLAPTDEVVALDLPGNGTRNAGNSPASVPAMAAACRQDLAIAAWSRPMCSWACRWAAWSPCMPRMHSQAKCRVAS